MNDRVKHTLPGGARRASGSDDRAALEQRLAEARASIRARIKRIESEVGPGPKALWAGAKKRPVASLLAAAAAGLLFGTLIFRKRRRTVRRVDPPGSPSGPPGGPGGGLRYLFWATLLQTGVGFLADAASDFFADRSGVAQRTIREKRSEADREEDGETQETPPHAEERSPPS